LKDMRASHFQSANKSVTTSFLVKILDESFPNGQYRVIIAIEFGFQLDGEPIRVVEQQDANRLRRFSRRTEKEGHPLDGFGACHLDRSDKLCLSMV